MVLKTQRESNGKPVDINVDGGNLISSTLFVCAVHLVSWELFVIVSPNLVSLYKFIVWFCCPVHSLAIVCFLPTREMNWKQLTWIVAQRALDFY